VATLPYRASSLTTALAGLGLLACIYLSGLKLLGAPCPVAGCDEIVNSRFGSVFGLPLPVLAVPPWIALCLPQDRSWLRRIQLVSSLCLALGSLVLLAIQFLVLRGFCPICTLHAAVAVAAAFALTLRGRAHAWLPALVLALALPLLFAARELFLGPFISPGTTGRSSAGMLAQRSVDQAAFSWLGPIDAGKSPVLVISFQCPHCLELFGQCLRTRGFGSLRGPKVLLFSSSDSSADSAAVLAAILSEPGPPQEQFAAVFGRLGSLFGPLMNHDSEELRSRLGALFPRYAGKLAAAREQLVAQSEALGHLPWHGTPFLLLPDGTVKYDVTPADVLLP
jgi:uncharacterized membrane protein